MVDTTVLKCQITTRMEDDDYFDKKSDIRMEEALVEAAAVGNLEKVTALLKAEVSVDAEEYNKMLFYASKNYMTPLQIAAANNHVECVQILINHGADVNAKDRFDVTALHMSAEKGNYACLKALLYASADCCLPTKFSKSGCYTAVPHLGGTTPLHLAAANNHVECVKELIQYGADYNAVDECGRTSLYIATQAGYDECVMAHLKNAVGRDILSLPSIQTSDTPLHFAVNRGMVDCVRELLYLGSDVNHLNHAGFSPLHAALTPCSDNASKSMEILKLLVLEGYNTDINLPDAADLTPLHYVCFNGRNLLFRRPNMAKFLIAYGANVNIKFTHGYSLLEHELKSSEKNYDILKHIVKSILHPPRLKCLNISPHRIIPALNGEEEIYIHRPAVHHDINMGANQRLGVFQLAPNYLNEQYRMNLIGPRIHYLPLDNENINGLAYIFRHAYPPVPLHIYDPYELAEFIDEQERDLLENEINGHHEHTCPHLLKKKLQWYESVASNPRTLQHYCRFVIRSTLGSSKMKFIKKLPVPPSLHSYLLLEYDD